MSFEESNPIKNIVEAVNIGLRQEGCFYRGEAENFPLPMPGIFRDKYWPFPESTKNANEIGPENVEAFDEIGTEKLRVIESNLIYEFKRLAPGLVSENKLPGENNPLNNLKWLFLMQHYGMPTRLLDWTENILVAIFIAVSNKDDKDGQIWVIQPIKLNMMAGIKGFPLPSHPPVECLAREMFYPRKAKGTLLKKLKLENFPEQPIAILPPLAWPRMIAQCSTFTLHPKPISQDKIFPPQAELIRHIIPAGHKLQLRKDLRKLGIQYRTLFPELDSISKDENQQLEDKKEFCQRQGKWSI